MSVAEKTSITRRPLLAGLLGLAGIAVAALATFEAPRLLSPRHAPSPFDDLLAKLPDRESAARLGAAFLAENRTFDADRSAMVLRRRLATLPLDAAIQSDLAEKHIVEAHGWVLPETLVSLCALAAKAA
jgi:hypothetical protein